MNRRDSQKTKGLKYPCKIDLEIRLDIGIVPLYIFTIPVRSRREVTIKFAQVIFLCPDMEHTYDSFDVYGVYTLKFWHPNLSIIHGRMSMSPKKNGHRMPGNHWTAEKRGRPVSGLSGNQQKWLNVDHSWPMTILYPRGKTKFWYMAVILQGMFPDFGPTNH